MAVALKATWAQIAGPEAAGAQGQPAQHEAEDDQRRELQGWKWTAAKTIDEHHRAQRGPNRFSRDRRSRPRKNSSSMTGAPMTT